MKLIIYTLLLVCFFFGIYACDQYFDVKQLGIRKDNPATFFLKLEIAMRKYQMEYGELPLVKTLPKNNDVVLNSTQYNELLQCLSNEGKIGGKLNPKGIIFLEKNHLTDFWDNELRVAFDMNNDKKIDGNAVNGFPYYNTDAGYMFWSLGPDGKEEIPFTNTLDGFNKDNIYWRPNPINILGDTPIVTPL